MTFKLLYFTHMLHILFSNVTVKCYVNSNIVVIIHAYFRLIAMFFRMGISTVREIVYETCDAIWQSMHEKYVKTPSTLEDWNVIAEEYVLYLYTNTFYAEHIVVGFTSHMFCSIYIISMATNYLWSVSQYYTIQCYELWKDLMDLNHN